MVKIDVSAVCELMKGIASAEVLPRFKNLSVSDINTKDAADDLVTIADTETEKALSVGLKALLPEASVVGEEAAFQDPSVLDCLNGDGPVWIVDPVDGTMNFSYGRSEFGMVVALVCKGETVAGWLYAPAYGLMICGEKGSGAFLEGGKRLSVSAPKTNMSDLIGIVGRRVMFKDKKMRAPAYWGSACFGYQMIVAGDADFTAYRTKSIKPWDHAAGVLLHAEAGGFTAYTDGTPYTPVMGYKNLISASTKDEWSYLCKNIAAPPL